MNTHNLSPISKLDSDDMPFMSESSDNLTKQLVDNLGVTHKSQNSEKSISLYNLSKSLKKKRKSSNCSKMRFSESGVSSKAKDISIQRRVVIAR